MNFNQVQIFEYALHCFSEIHTYSTESDHKFNFVVQSNDDVFIAESYFKGPRDTPTTQRLNLEKEVVDEPFSPNNVSSNPYQKIRSKVYGYFTSEWGINTTSMVKNPHILLEILLEISNNIESESSENNIWYNYRSLKHNYSLDFKRADISKEYSIVSLASQN